MCVPLSFIRGEDYQGAEVIRPYTPITLDSDVGFFELVVKVHPSEVYHLWDSILVSISVDI